MRCRMTAWITGKRRSVTMTLLQHSLCDMFYHQDTVVVLCEVMLRAVVVLHLEVNLLLNYGLKTGAIGPRSSL